jgi:hypothetical protein
MEETLEGGQGPPRAVAPLERERDISCESNSHIYFQCIFIITNIKQVKAIIANYLGDVPPKYIAYLMGHRLSLIPLKHINSISKAR